MSYIKKQTMLKPKIKQTRELDEYDKNLRKILWLILGIYTISLFLPAFGWANESFPEKQVFMTGVSALTISIFFGWFPVIAKGIVGSLAGYANLFFLWVILCLFQNKEKLPKISVVFMVILSLLSFFKNAGGEIPTISRWISEQRIGIWGYGAYCWFFSIFATVYIVINRLINSEKIFYIRNFIIVFFVVLGVLLGVQYYRYEKSNEIEKDIYFSNKVLLTTIKMSGAEYNPPQKIGVKLNKDDIIQINNPIDLDEEFLPARVQDDKHFYVIYHLGCYDLFLCSRIAELHPKKQANYIYNVDGYHHSISDINEKLLWQADTRVFNYTYKEKIKEFFGVLSPINLADEKDGNFIQFFHQETFLQSNQCQVKNLTYNKRSDSDFKIDINFKLYDKNFYIKDYQSGKLLEYQLWCGKHYDLLFRSIIKNGNHNHVGAILFDKEIGKPIKVFYYKNSDNHHNEYKHFNYLKIKWIDLSNDSVYDKFQKEKIMKPVIVATANNGHILLYDPS